MKRTDVVVIGGGPAGLAMSRCLTDSGVDHVVLERGRVAERWRSERWDSLHLLTPSWQSRLPGFRYDGPSPDGYMSATELVCRLDRYARSLPAPIEERTSVVAVDAVGSGYRVTTDRGTFSAPSVVIATGQCDTPLVPALSRRLPPDVVQIVPSRYRNARELPEGGVLVVGASATGVQLADEIQASGRPVTLAVGRHTRLPRVHRGRDIMWWLDAAGILDETAEEVRDLAASRRQPSLQLVGQPGVTIDLPALAGRGVRLAGKLADVDGSRVSFAGDLPAHLAAADARLERVLQRIDLFAARTGIEAEVGPKERPRPLRSAPFLLDGLDLDRQGIRTVVWATGFRRLYPWLRVPALDARGEIVHRGGVTPHPGLYTLGLHFLRRRNSSFLDGIGRDAIDLTIHLTSYLRKAA